MNWKFATSSAVNDSTDRCCVPAHNRRSRAEIPSVNNTKEVGDGVGGQSGPDRGEHVEGVVGVGKLGVADGGGAGIAQRGAKGARLHARNHRIVLTVQHKKWRRGAAYSRNGGRRFEQFRLVG